MQPCLLLLQFICTVYIILVYRTPTIQNYVLRWYWYSTSLEISYMHVVAHLRHRRRAHLTERCTSPVFQLGGIWCMTLLTILHTVILPFIYSPALHLAFMPLPEGASGYLGHIYYRFRFYLFILLYIF